MTRRSGVAALLGTLLALSALVPATAADAATRKPVAVFAAPGPYAAGVTTLTIGDRQAEVWYPAPRAAVRHRRRDVYEIAKWLPPALQDLLKTRNVKAPFTTDAYRGVKASAKGPFPLVIFAHGFSAYRDQSTFLTAHLATWGFVVASPDFLERGLASQLGEPPATPRTEDDVIQSTITAVRRASASRHSILRATVRKGRIGIVGHSAGGFTAIRYGAQPDVRTYVSLSAGRSGRPGTAPITPPDKPSMFIVGAQDGIVPPDSVRSAYAAAPAPKRLVVIDGSGHLNAMSDICEIGKGGGGVVALAQQAGLGVPPNLQRLGTDGCFPPARPSRQVWPVTRHFTTAQLRYELGVDKRPVGLAPSVVKAFLPVKVTYSQVITR